MEKRISFFAFLVVFSLSSHASGNSNIIEECPQSKTFAECLTEEAFASSALNTGDFELVGNEAFIEQIIDIGNSEVAKKMLLRFKDKFPEDIKSQTLRIKLLFASEEYDEGLATLKKQLSDENRAVNSEVIWALYSTGQFSRVVEVSKILQAAPQPVKEVPASGNVSVISSQCLRDLKRYPLPLGYAGIKAIENGDIETGEEAIQILRNFLEQDGQGLDYCYSRAGVHIFSEITDILATKYLEQNETDKAKVLYYKTIRFLIGRFGNLWREDPFLDLAKSASKNEIVDDIQHIREHFISISRPWISVRSQKVDMVSLLYAYEGKPDQALKRILQLPELFPDPKTKRVRTTISQAQMQTLKVMIQELSLIGNLNESSVYLEFFIENFIGLSSSQETKFANQLFISTMLWKLDRKEESKKYFELAEELSSKINFSLSWDAKKLAYGFLEMKYRHDGYDAAWTWYNENTEAKDGSVSVHSGFLLKVVDENNAEDYNKAKQALLASLETEKPWIGFWHNLYEKLAATNLSTYLELAKQTNFQNQALAAIVLLANEKSHNEEAIQLFLANCQKSCGRGFLQLNSYYATNFKLKER